MPRFHAKTIREIQERRIRDLSVNMIIQKDVYFIIFLIKNTVRF